MIETLAIPDYDRSDKPTDVVGKGKGKRKKKSKKIEPEISVLFYLTYDLSDRILRLKYPEGKKMVDDDYFKVELRLRLLDVFNYIAADKTSIDMCDPDTVTRSLQKRNWEELKRRAKTLLKARLMEED